MKRWARAAQALAVVGCLWLHLAWAGEAFVRHQIPLWDGMAEDQKRCHLEAWLSGDPAVFGAGRCESLE